MGLGVWSEGFRSETVAYCPGTDFVGHLSSLAEGRTQAPMSTEFRISQVYIFNDPVEYRVLIRTKTITWIIQLIGPYFLNLTFPSLHLNKEKNNNNKKNQTKNKKG